MLLLTSGMLTLSAEEDELKHIVRLSNSRPQEALQLAREQPELNLEIEMEPELRVRMTLAIILARNERMSEARAITRPAIANHLSMQMHPFAALTHVLLDRNGLTPEQSREIIIYASKDGDALLRSYASVAAAAEQLDQSSPDQARALLDEAKRFYRKAVPEPTYETHVALIVRQELDRYLALCERADRLIHMGPAIAAFQEADEQRASGHWQAAEQAFLTVRSDFPSHPITSYALLGAVRCQLAMEQRDQAIDCYGHLSQEDTWVALQAAMAIGDDSAFRGHHLREAMQWWSRALKHLDRGMADSVQRFTPAPALAARLLQEPRYRLEAGTPTWAASTPGHIIHPSSAWAISELPFLLYARMAAGSLLEGKHRKARTFAEASVVFDALSRSYDEHGSTTASMILAAGAERGYFLVPSDDLKHIDDDGLRLLVVFGGMYDSLYHFERSAQFGSRLLKDMGDDHLVEQIGHFLIARSAYARNRRQEAREHILAVPLTPTTELSPEVWVQAMGLRWSLLHQRDETLEEAAAVLPPLVRFAPRHRITRVSLLGAAMVFERRDPERALSLLAMYKSIAPKAFKGYPQELYENITATLSAKE